MVKIDGLKGLVTKLKSVERGAQTKTKAAILKAGSSLNRNAKRRVPVDTGKLRQSIFFEVLDGGLTAKNTANAPYAPYVEFGTGGKVSVPDGWKEVAITFKGRGIREVNLPPRPYLIPSFNDAKKELIQDLEKIAKEIEK